jgi:hypothetical protein
VTPTDAYDNIEIKYQPTYNVRLIKPELRYLPSVIYGYMAVFEEV